MIAIMPIFPVLVIMPKHLFTMMPTLSLYEARTQKHQDRGNIHGNSQVKMMQTESMWDISSVCFLIFSHKLWFLLFVRLF